MHWITFELADGKSVRVNIAHIAFFKTLPALRATGTYVAMVDGSTVNLPEVDMVTLTAKIDAATMRPQQNWGPR